MSLIALIILRTLITRITFDTDIQVLPHGGARDRISIAFNVEIVAKPPFTKIKTKYSFLSTDGTLDHKKVYISIYIYTLGY